MSTHATDDGLTDEDEQRGQPAGTATIESYETETGVVFYDAENPLAWMETTRTMDLEEFA